MLQSLTLGTNEWMMIWGAGIALFALFIIWRVSRYDLAGAAVDSAWQVATGQRTSENPTALEQKLRDINAGASVGGKAKRAAGTVIGHFAAKVANFIAILMLLAGGGLIAAGYFWR